MPTKPAAGRPASARSRRPTPRTGRTTRPRRSPGWPAAPRPTCSSSGSGTGKLTRSLMALGHRVVATDPLVAMLAELKRVAPGARRVAARAESIPLAAGVVDLVVSAQAFHWFDPERALPEIARVLRPGGVLRAGLEHRGLQGPVGTQGPQPDRDDGGRGHVSRSQGSDLFAIQERRTFRHWQKFDRESLVGYISSSSHAAIMTPDERRPCSPRSAAIYDSYGRGHDGMLMPWRRDCFRATVTELAPDRATGRFGSRRRAAHRLRLTRRASVSTWGASRTHSR